MNKMSMAVPEMQRILGLGRTEAYWLVKKKYFDTIVIAGKTRVMIDSFEKWYARQLHYKKVDGTPPGAHWTATTMSIRETADLLGITESTLYRLLQHNPFKTEKVGMYTRIYKDSFGKWYGSQSVYKKAHVHTEAAECLMNGQPN